MKLIKRRFATLSILIITGLLLGCAGLNPASAPAPVAEIPSALSLPESVAVGTPEVAPAGGAGVQLKFASRLVNFVKGIVQDVGGEFFEAIIFGFNINQLTDAAVSGVLGELSQLEIPLNPVTTTFEAADAFLGSTVKIDFSDYDYDGDGATEGCTGCTCPTGCEAPCPTEAPIEALSPVCYRIWSDFNNDPGVFTPFMAGVLDLVPIKDDPNTPEDEENPGVGTFRLRVVNIPGAPGEEPEQVTNVGSNYNHRNFDRPLDEITEYFLYIDEASAPMPPDATVSHVLVQQQAIGDVNDESMLLKTIQESLNQPVGDNTDSNLQYIARYRTDFDFWSGTFLDNLQFSVATAFAVPPDIDNFVAACAQLSTAIGVDQNTCIDLGIDVTDVPFLSLVFPDDPEVNLPADFPPTPPF